MNLTFLGGTGTVTGSKYLVEAEGSRILVDCGLFQGLKALRLRNWRPFPVEPASIDAVLLTHAHLDHSGFLPRLIQKGFSGPIYCTDGTLDLCRILLPDSGHLQEEDARYANQRGFSRHKPALPLYTRDDAVRAIESFRGQPFGKDIALGSGLRFRFRRAGHILGAAAIELRTGGRTVLFSGDVGRPADPIMKRPEPPGEVDYLIVESTYGDRTHPRENHALDLARAVLRLADRNGVLLVPAFAVGRAQTLLHLLARLKASHEIPDVPVFLNSPMAIDATHIFCAHPEDHRLSEEQCGEMCRVAEYVNDPEASKALNERAGPMVIISASGMATGGRILHHLKAFAPDPRNAILFVGFQAAGTRGEAIVKGAKTVKIHGQHVPIGAEVIHSDGLSAHADSGELLRWLHHAKQPPNTTFVTHGEKKASATLRSRIEADLGWRAEVPQDGQRVTL